MDTIIQPRAAGPGGGKIFRLQRIFRDPDIRTFIVPMDHSFTDGAPSAAARTNELVGMLARHGADAVVLHKGRIRLVDPYWLARLGLVVHLSGSTAGSLDPDAKVLVGSVDEAAALGADAVSVHVNVGSATETQQLRDFGSVAAQCSRLGMPLLAMMYARGERVRDEASPEVLSHLAAIAVDLGADVVKLVYSGSSASMRDVVAGCRVPVVVAGGPAKPSEDDVLAFVRDAVASGGNGLAIGRNVFSVQDPSTLIRRIARIVHPGQEPVAPRPASEAATAWEA